MSAEECSEAINHRNIAVTAPALSKWLTTNKSQHLQLLYWQVSVTDDVHILNDSFFLYKMDKTNIRFHFDFFATWLWNCFCHGSVNSRPSLDSFLPAVTSAAKDIISFCNFVFFLKVASCNNFFLISYLFFIIPIEWNILLHASNLASFTTFTHLGYK